jgi:hypothetical protein
MASLTDLPGLAEQILAVFGAQLTALDVDLPERQYVAAGSQIVWDGEQMTVALMGITQGQPGLGQASTMVPQRITTYATFSVNLVRSVTVINTEGFTLGEIPTADEQDADGKHTITDAQALMLAGISLAENHLLAGVGEGFVIDGLQPLGPEGGLVASRLLVSLSLS